MLHAMTIKSEDSILHYTNKKPTKVCVCILLATEALPDNELLVRAEENKTPKVKRVIREKFAVEQCLEACAGNRTDIYTWLHFMNRKGHIFYAGYTEKCSVARQMDPG